MKQEERRQQTIRRLLEATRMLIQEKGCHAITMSDIMAQSQLSKGAIFHYVKSKDEIFAWLLQERLEETNQQFVGEVEQGKGTFEGPMQKIKLSLPPLESPDEITNKVLVYLLGRENEPAVAEVLRLYYERSVSFSKSWIAAGQQNGVIPASVNADQTAELFVLISLGLRVRSTLPTGSAAFTADTYASFIADHLKKSD